MKPAPVNDYQSGGDMWYATFDRTLVILIGASIIFIGYVAIRTESEAFDNGYLPEFKFGPFWFCIPMPFFISYFWRTTHSTFRIPTSNLSMDSAVKIDQVHSQYPAEDNFSENLYRQPDLAESALKPEPYRRRVRHFNAKKNKKRWIPTTDAPDKDEDGQNTSEDLSMATLVLDRLLWRDRALSETTYGNDMYTHQEMKAEVLREGVLRQDRWYAYKDYKEHADEYEDQFDNVELLGESDADSDNSDGSDSSDGGGNMLVTEGDDKYVLERNAQRYFQRDVYQDNDTGAGSHGKAGYIQRSPNDLAPDIEEGAWKSMRGADSLMELNVPKEAHRPNVLDPREKAVRVLRERPSVRKLFSERLGDFVSRARSFSFTNSVDGDGGDVVGEEEPNYDKNKKKLHLPTNLIGVSQRRRERGEGTADTTMRREAPDAASQETKADERRSEQPKQQQHQPPPPAAQGIQATADERGVELRERDALPGEPAVSRRLQDPLSSTDMVNIANFKAVSRVAGSASGSSKPKRLAAVVDTALATSLSLPSASAEFSERRNVPRRSPPMRTHARNTVSDGAPGSGRAASNKDGEFMLLGDPEHATVDTSTKSSQEPTVKPSMRSRNGKSSDAALKSKWL